MKENRHVFILIFILSAFDLLAINGSCLIVSLFYLKPFNAVQNCGLLLAVNISWLLSALANKLYRYNSVQAFSKMSYKTVLSYCCQVLILYVISSNVPILQVDKSFYFYFLTAEISSLLIVRFVIRVTELRSLKLSRHRKTIAIIGDDEISGKLAEFFRQHKRSFNFAGHFNNLDESFVKNELEKLKLNVEHAINGKFDEVYSTVFPKESEDLNRLIKLAERHCIRLKFVTTSGEYESRLQKFPNSYSLSGYFNGMPILLNRRDPLNLLRNRIWKRSFDIAFSLVVILLLLSWMYPILAIIIRMDSPGPILFKQQRSGRNNKPFWCYKFRSMRVNQNSDILQATKNDSRVTKIGAFLRKKSIDELPQFFNVLIGNMSIVGPRPHMLNHTVEYQGVVDQYMVRLFSKPGITGWAQINGYRGETKDPQQMQNRINHDIWYMENWLLVHDLKIVCKTFINVIKGQETAY